LKGIKAVFMEKNVLLKGFTTGIILQIAIGPVFVFILNISFQFGILNGLFAVLGVTVVDYLYIILAIFGVGKFLEIKKVKQIFSIISSIVLIIFGIYLFKKGILFYNNDQITIIRTSLWGSFMSTFILTLSSPLTILFWTSIFTNKAIEYSLNKNELVFFGLSAGLATLVFLGCSVSIFSLFNLMVPKIAFQILNIFVGLLLIGFGVLRILKDFKKSV